MKYHILGYILYRGKLDRVLGGVYNLEYCTIASYVICGADGVGGAGILGVRWQMAYGIWHAGIWHLAMCQRAMWHT